MEQLIKIIVVGDSGVGKSTMLMRFEKNIFDELFIPTVGIDFLIKKIQVNDKLYKLHLWDMAGQERYKSIVNTYYRNGQGIILAFDIANMSSFENLQNWIDSINKYSPANSVLFIVGTKSDLENDRIVTHEEAKKFANSLNIEYYEVSSKNEYDIEGVFMDIIKKIQIEIDINAKLKTGTKVDKIKLKEKQLNKKCCV